MAVPWDAVAQKARHAVAQKARPRLTARTAAVAAFAVCVPVLFVGNGLYVLLHEWFVRAEYARPGFPEDEFGITTAERTRLAVVGLDSIVPWSRDGIDTLREARLDTGEPAFGEEEVRHMEDVRRLLAILLAVHAVTLVTIVALASVRRTRRLARDALRAGAFFTLGLFALVGVLLLVEPDWFLTSFHTIFFEGSSWRFGDRETLRRLFPDLFWDDTTLILGVGALLQAAGVLVATSWWRRRRREEPRVHAAN
jgi:integral membrane protein (TIGR01906 family)